MRLPRRGLAFCLLLGARMAAAQTASREYRPQLFITSPAWQASRVGEFAYSRIRKLGRHAATWTLAAVATGPFGLCGATRIL